MVDNDSRAHLTTLLSTSETSLKNEISAAGVPMCTLVPHDQKLAVKLRSNPRSCMNIVRFELHLHYSISFSPWEQFPKGCILHFGYKQILQRHAKSNTNHARYPTSPPSSHRRPHRLHLPRQRCLPSCPRPHRHPLPPLQCRPHRP